MQFITKEHLRKNPNHIFIFGDNLDHMGKGGAALLRDEPNTHGFVTKKYPNNLDSSFYRPKEYKKIFDKELEDLIWAIKDYPHITFLISKLGAGLANKYKIWEKVVHPGLEQLKVYPNAKLLYEEEV